MLENVNRSKTRRNISNVLRECMRIVLKYFSWSHIVCHFHLLELSRLPTIKQITKQTFWKREIWQTGIDFLSVSNEHLDLDILQVCLTAFEETHSNTNTWMYCGVQESETTCEKALKPFYYYYLFKKHCTAVSLSDDYLKLPVLENVKRSKTRRHI